MEKSIDQRIAEIKKRRKRGEYYVPHAPEDINFLLSQLAKRDKELERIKTAVAEKGGTEDYPTEDAYLTACEALAKAHKEIERLREARGWISVEEKLPEEAYGCLLIVEADNYWGEPRKVLLPYFAGYDGTQWNDADGEQVAFEVTHWTPLPEPPKEGAEE